MSTTRFHWQRKGMVACADGTYVHAADYERLTAALAESERLRLAAEAELASARAYIARVQGAAVPFELSESGAVLMGDAQCLNDVDTLTLACDLRRCMADLSFAQEQHKAQCDRASEVTMRVNDLEVFLDLARFQMGGCGQCCNSPAMDKGDDLIGGEK